MSDKKTIEDILRHLYVTAVQDADGVRADRKGYHMRYDEVPAQATQAIEALITQQRQELMEEPVKLLEDALQKFSELWKMWAMIDYGIDSNMEKIENYLNKLSKEKK